MTNAELIPSIFNDVIGPVMRGPSSSHSAASVRIGRLIHDLCGGTPDRATMTYDLLGSLATTHIAQGTDMGLYAGFMNWEADDPHLAQSPSTLAEQGCILEVVKPELGDAHPNTYRISVERAGETHEVVALSTGGGIIEVIEIDGAPTRLYGDFYTTLIYGDEQVPASVEAASDSIITASGPNQTLTIALGRTAPTLEADVDPSKIKVLRPVLPVMSQPSGTISFSHASEVEADPSSKQRPLSDWAIKYEMERGGISEAEVLAKAKHILDIMRQGVKTGLAGTSYDDRILGHQVGEFVEKDRKGELLNGGVLNTMIAYVTALMEAKSAMEVIVAAPTAGACATFPGALIAALDDRDHPEEDGLRALLAGGLIGVFFTNRSSFAAEVGGCQAETGAGSAMAAAALVELGGGPATQSLSAASQAIQNVLGLICDPIGNRVEAPCLGRNVAGAANALSCANMALAGYDHLVCFDEVLDAHKEVSRLMARELRCTGLGGLAVTPTARKIELGLTRRSSGS